LSARIAWDSRTNSIRSPSAKRFTAKLLGLYLCCGPLSSHIFLVAAMIAALPAAVSFRFFLAAGFGAGAADGFGSELPLAAAHLLRYASAMACVLPY